MEKKTEGERAAGGGGERETYLKYWQITIFPLTQSKAVGRSSCEHASVSDSKSMCVCLDLCDCSSGRLPGNRGRQTVQHMDVMRADTSSHLWPWPAARVTV